MRRRFIARRRNEMVIIKIIALIFLVYLAYFFIIRPLFRLRPEFEPNHLLSLASNDMLGESFFSNNFSLPLNNPNQLLGLNLIDFEVNPPIINAQPVIRPIEESENLPIVYIYNTHPNEEFYPGSLAIHNITPNVIMASYMLQSALAEHGIVAVVEERDVRDILRANNWNFSRSYQASRKLMESARDEHPTIRYFIDVHRDAVAGTTTIDGVRYARMMFVIGQGNPNYQMNESLMLRIHQDIEQNYHDLMRRPFYNRTSRFNQDISPGVILLEVGDPRNTIDEVHNSINVFAAAFARIIGE